MKRICFYLALLLVLSLTIPAYADSPVTGNGAPSGAHYNLNIIGVPKDKSATMDDKNGHRIFVNLEGKTKIMLGMGEFRVMDANGTDGDGAMFLLPCPDPDNDGVTEYSVWVRALGKPNNSAGIAACYVLDGSEYCEEHRMIIRMKGNGNKFVNVSKDLFYVYADLEDDDGVPERYPLFDGALEGYFWDYDNKGLKLAQFRFYEVPTDVTQLEAMVQP